MKYPQIRIKSSFLLNDKVISLLLPQLEKLGRLEESEGDFIDSKVESYKRAWEKYERLIVPAMCGVLDLEFKQNIIDMYVCPFSNSFSDPMVISSRYSSDRVIDIITHELTHRLVTDNTKLPMKDGRKISQHFQDIFGEYPFKVLTHIPVHAMLEYIYVDVLKDPSRLERDKTFCKNFPVYDQAWKYVEEVGYQNILSKLRACYDWCGEH